MRMKRCRALVPLAAACGIAGPSILAGALALAELARPGEAFSVSVGTLASLSSPTGALVTAGLVTFGALVVVFAFGLHAVLPGRSWPAPLATALVGLGAAGIAAFPCASGCVAAQGAPLPQAEIAHAAAVMLTVGAAVLAPLLVALRLGSHRTWRALRSYCEVSGTLLLLGVTAAPLAAGGPAAGVPERAALPMGLVWLTVMGFVGVRTALIPPPAPALITVPATAAPDRLASVNAGGGTGDFFNLG